MIKIAIPTNLKKGDKISIDCIPAGKIMEVDILDTGLSIWDTFSEDLFSFRFKYKNQYYWHDSNCIINEFYKETELISVEPFDKPIGTFYGDSVYERVIKYKDNFYKVFKGTYTNDSEGNKYFISYK